jgi:hypothetical protein
MTRVAPVLLACAAALASAPALRAQEEPPLIQPTTPPPKPALPSAPAPGGPAARLRAALDFPRWQEMTARERQSFVEGAVMALSIAATGVKSELGTPERTPAERLAAEVKFVRDTFPRFPAGDYLQEMEHVYLTAEGQNLSMGECFLQAFRRINGR